jgi:hypothetical protein
MKQRKVRGSVHDTNLDGKWFNIGTHVIFCVEIGAEFEKRARDVTFSEFARVMKRRFSSFLEILCSHTMRNVRRMSTCHPFEQRDNEPCWLRWDLGRCSQADPRPAHDLLMKRNEVRSIHSGDITTPSTQQHPSEPRHIHRQKSATRLQTPTNLSSRIGISAGLEEQLHDRRITPC